MRYSQGSGREIGYDSQVLYTNLYLRTTKQFRSRDYLCYLKCDFPMSPNVRLSVGRSVIISTKNFLKLITLKSLDLGPSFLVSNFSKIHNVRSSSLVPSDIIKFL